VTADAGTPVLVVPGWTGSGPGHWQTLWQRRHPDWLRVEQEDWDRPDPGSWMRALDEAVRAASSPPLLVAHSLGCVLVAAWAGLGPAHAAGALLVAPSDVERRDAPPPIRRFAPVPLAPLPFPSVLAWSEDDPLLDPERARTIAAAWGSVPACIGAAGHVNTAAGYGAWPGGLRLVARLRRLARSRGG
jgi:uncharacterized protein